MKILVSACLLGMSCRYDGASKENAEILNLSAKHSLIPFCPEIYGGLPTPREPSEIRDSRVYSKSGADVTEAFERGAREALRLARALGCDCALLQDRSPSCGIGAVYDGSFSRKLTAGDGLTARLLTENGLRVLPASRAAELNMCPCDKRCHRHGDCGACREHHLGRRHPPCCERAARK